MKGYFIFFLILFSFKSNAQKQDYQIMNFDFNKSIFNPSYVGNRNAISITNTYQNIYLNEIIYSPRNNLFSINMPLLKDKIGIGFSFIYSDYKSMYNRDIQFDLEYNLDFAYRLKFGKKSKQTLSFGLNTNLSNVHFGYMGVGNKREPNVVTYNAFNFGLGVNYQNDNFFAGFSILKILNTYAYLPDNIPLQIYNKRNPKIKITEYQSFKKNNRSYVVMIGGLINIINPQKFQILPSMFLSINEELNSLNNPSVNQGLLNGHVKINSKFILNNKYWLGLGYNKNFIAKNNQFTPNTLVTSIGINIIDKIDIAYTFNYNFYKDSYRVENFLKGGHEILFRVDIKTTKNENTSSTRYF